RRADARLERGETSADVTEHAGIDRCESIRISRHGLAAVQHVRQTSSTAFECRGSQDVLSTRTKCARHSCASHARHGRSPCLWQLRLPYYFGLRTSDFGLRPEGSIADLFPEARSPKPEARCV